MDYLWQLIRASNGIISIFPVLDALHYTPVLERPHAQDRLYHVPALDTLYAPVMEPLYTPALDTLYASALKRPYAPAPEITYRQSLKSKP